MTAIAPAKTRPQFMTQERFTRIDECVFVGSFYGLDQLPKDRRPQIAFAGRSNVGKSSLLNRLTGRKKLAKTSQTPGKTRSLNFFAVNQKFYFVDLPGYGYARASKTERKSWGRLVESYLEKSPDLIGLVLLLDCRRDPTPEDIQLLEWLTSKETPALIIITKTDKLTRDKVNRKVQQTEEALGVSAIPFSAVTGYGKKELFGAIGDLIAEKMTK